MPLLPRAAPSEPWPRIRPVTIVRPTWSTWSFLVYAGGLTTVFALGGWAAYVARHSGRAGDFGWTLLLFAVLAAIAEAFRRTGHRVTGGVFAFGAVAAGAAAAGLLFRWFGWNVVPGSPVRGLHPSLLLLEAVWAGLAVAALRRFRFPLLVAHLAAAVWAFVVDLISNGGAWTAIVSTGVGVAYLAAAVRLDRGERRPYGFWLQVAAGLATGGAILHWLAHGGTLSWVLVALFAVGYVLLASPLERSSWAVLGTVGLFAAAVHFAVRWVSASLFFLRGHGDRLWAPPLAFTCLGVLLVALGLLSALRPAADR
jgi:hypothetical protein